MFSKLPIKKKKKFSKLISDYLSVLVLNCVLHVCWGGYILVFVNCVFELLNDVEI